MDRIQKQNEAMADGTMSHTSTSHTSHSFDSNCITPGTEFMSKLSANIIYYVRRKIKEDSVWQRMRVIFSGSEVPGMSLFTTVYCLFQSP